MRIIVIIKTKYDPRIELVATHFAVTGDGRRSSLVVQADPKTLGDVQDKKRTVV